MSYSIPISGLNEMIVISMDDFIPIVDSSSLTTFRASIKNLGNALTTASSSWASQSLSSSYSPWADYANSASWASQSLSASWANNAVHVNLTGSQNYFPFWSPNKVNGWEANGGLSGDTAYQASGLYSYDGLGYFNVIAVGEGDMNTAPTQVNPSHPTYYVSSSFSRNMMGFWGNARYGYGGLWAGIKPIISNNFVGTDQIQWFFSSSVNTSSNQTNQIWSGSLFNGFMYTMTPGDTSAISGTFNGKWIRIACAGSFPSLPNIPTDAAAYGERNGTDQGGLFGRMRVWVNASADDASVLGSSQLIDLHIDSQNYAGGIEVDVIASSHYEYDFIRKIRVCKSVPEYAGDYRDALHAIDLFIDGIPDGITDFSIALQSWGGIQFLRYLNLDPNPLYSTGSGGPTSATGYLIVPAAPGHYGNHTLDQNYYIQGHNVVITPSYNVLTESYGYGTFIPVSPYALHTDGTIDSDGYYCGDHQGLTTKLTLGGVDLYFSGGILVSGTLPPTPPTPPGPCEGPFYKSGVAALMPGAPIYCNLGSGLGTVNFLYHAHDKPVRYVIHLGNTTVLDSGYRGSETTATLNAYLAPWGSSSYISGGPTGTLSFSKLTSTQNVATVSVFRPSSGDAWDYTMYCPS